MTVRFARADDVPLLPAIEQRAANRFVSLGLAFAAALPTQSLADLRAAEREGRLLVAADDEDAPVGFALLVLADAEDAHLHELDVDPAHNGRGLGRALIARAVVWARDRGRRRLTLTTFREVPFNAPYYARIGFVEIAPADLTPALRALREAERAHGVERSPRLAMALDVKAVGESAGPL